MIFLPLIDEQKCPRAVKHMCKGKFCLNSQKTALEEDFAVRKHHRTVIETELTYLVNAASLTMTVFANYHFLCFSLVNNFVVNAM